MLSRYGRNGSGKHRNDDKRRRQSEQQQLLAIDEKDTLISKLMAHDYTLIGRTAPPKTKPRPPPARQALPANKPGSLIKMFQNKWTQYLEMYTGKFWIDKPPQTANSLRFASWKIHGAWQGKHERGEIAQRHNLDVIALQETLLEEVKRFTFREYEVYRENRGARRGGTAILLKKGLKYHISI